MAMNSSNHRIYSISVASVYPMYVAKAEKKGRTKAEVDEIIRWRLHFGAGGSLRGVSLMRVRDGKIPEALANAKVPDHTAPRPE